MKRATSVLLALFIVAMVVVLLNVPLRVRVGLEHELEPQSTPSYSFRNVPQSGAAFVPGDTMCAFVLVAYGKEVLRVEPGGRILVDGQPIKGDKALVDALRKFIAAYEANLQ